MLPFAHEGHSEDKRIGARVLVPAEARRAKEGRAHTIRLLPAFHAVVPRKGRLNLVEFPLEESI